MLFWLMFHELLPCDRQPQQTPERKDDIVLDRKEDILSLSTSPML